jgi:hypothetical protein
MDTAFLKRGRTPAITGSRLSAVVAATAGLVLSALGLIWLVRGDRNPLDHADSPFSTALVVYRDGWANGVFLGCSLVALVGGLWLLRDVRAGVLNRVAVPWVAGASIVALLVLMDASSLMAAGYLPATLVGSLLGLGEANLSVLLSAGLLLQMTFLVTVAAFGAIIAGRVRDGLREAERTETPPQRAQRLAQASSTK